MPDFIRDIPVGRWEYALQNTEITPAFMAYSTGTALARSSMLGVVKVRHRVVFYSNVLAKPHIDSITPDSALQGSPDTVATLVGSFNPNDLAYWNSVPIATTWLNAYTMSVTIPASLLAVDGCGAIAVANEAGDWSNALSFDVIAGEDIVIY